MLDETEDESANKDANAAAADAGQSSGEASSGATSESDSAGEKPEAGSQKHLDRPSAQEIYAQVSKNAKAELKRSTISLAISGFAGGVFMGLSALGTAITLGIFGRSPLTHFIAMMFYPLGFIVVILGRAQLFTENTLYPVALVLAEKRQFWNTMRLWCTVLPANVLGALAFATLAARTSALPGPTKDALVWLGMKAAAMPPHAIFWSAVTAGWIIATAAWLVSGSHSITGSVMILWMLTFVVGLGGFAHCIATSGEILAAVLTGQVAVGSYFHWFWLAVLGNICGGVGMVTLLEYGQVIYGGDKTAANPSGEQDLSAGGSKPSEQ
jgi:formate/nitrite transporter FocA (FNT family)